ASGAGDVVAKDGGSVEVGPGAERRQGSRGAHDVGDPTTVQAVVRRELDRIDGRALSQGAAPELGALAAGWPREPGADRVGEGWATDVGAVGEDQESGHAGGNLETDRDGLAMGRGPGEKQAGAANQGMARCGRFPSGRQLAGWQPELDERHAGSRCDP